MNLDKDGMSAVVSYVKKYGEPNVLPKRLKIKALDKEALYEVVETGEVFGGDELMYIGLEIGEIMGKTENWARVNFYRAKERLKKEIEKNEQNSM